MCRHSQPVQRFTLTMEADRSRKTISLFFRKLDHTTHRGEIMIAMVILIFFYTGATLPMSMTPGKTKYSETISTYPIQRLLFLPIYKQHSLILKLHLHGMLQRIHKADRLRITFAWERHRAD